jgi:UDP-glucose 4-epimerase
VDLAIGHLKALEKIEKKPGLVTYNLGTGMGNSVLEVIEAFETATNAKINREIVARRPGDAKACYADPSFAEQELGWKAERDIKQMCADSWNWQSKNPNGFEK